MKKFFAVLSALALLLCCLSSCSNNQGSDPTNTPPTTVSDGVHFGTVSDLLSAIKHDPYHYIDKEIQVKGTLCKFESDNIAVLFDLSEALDVKDGVALRYAARKGPNIEITIPDEIMNTVIESGDYIAVTGAVKISDGEIYLDNCTYTFIS